MHNYNLTPIESIKNNTFTFYKLSVDGDCLFDEFEQSLTQKSDKASLISIYSLMDNISHRPLPQTLFNHINGGKKAPDNIYEFKKRNLRVYVIMATPNIVVILGGFKKTQKSDIKKAIEIATNFNKVYTK